MTDTAAVFTGGSDGMKVGGAMGTVLGALSTTPDSPALDLSALGQIHCIFPVNSLPKSASPLFMRVLRLKFFFANKFADFSLFHPLTAN